MAKHNPYSVKIELARGCTRRCPFCTLSTINWKDDAWQFIKVELFEEICADLATWCPKVRIEMDERGEPSFHPKLLELFSIARKHLPKAQLCMISNGDMIDKKKDKKVYKQWVQSMFDNGLNVLIFDCYETERLELMKKVIPQAIIYGNDKSQTSPWTYTSPKRRDIYLLPGFLFNQDITRKIRNQGGNVDVIKSAVEGFVQHSSVEAMADKMCTRPFRELVIHSDGTIPLCCDDWRQEGKVGVYGKDIRSLKKAWYTSLNKYRKNLINHDRTKQSPCKNCNTPNGFRSGLEMAWFAKEK